MRTGPPAARSSRPRAPRASPRQRHRTDMTDALAHRTRAGLHRTASTAPTVRCLVFVATAGPSPGRTVAAVAVTVHRGDLESVDEAMKIQREIAIALMCR